MNRFFYNETYFSPLGPGVEKKRRFYTPKLYPSL